MHCIEELSTYCSLRERAVLSARFHKHRPYYIYEHDVGEMIRLKRDNETMITTIMDYMELL